MRRLSLLFTLSASLIASSIALSAQKPSHSNSNSLNPTTPAAASASKKTSREQLSYSIGADLGENFKQQDINIDPTELAQGIKDAYLGKPALSRAQIEDILKNFQQQLIAKKTMEFKMLSAKNKQQGDAYLAAHKSQPGVITTPSGIQYKVIKAGSGEMPKDTSTVKVMYTGKFIDGSIFDKSKDPVTFSVNSVISGWTEILKLMQPGAEFKVAIPPQYAYGERGIDRAIGPNQTLLFDIRLLEVKNNTKK